MADLRGHLRRVQRPLHSLFYFAAVLLFCYFELSNGALVTTNLLYNSDAEANCAYTAATNASGPLFNNVFNWTNPDPTSLTWACRCNNGSVGQCPLPYNGSSYFFFFNF